jgi:RND superfamily putative drug exporter
MLPPLVGILAIAGTLLGLLLFAEVTDISVFAINLVTGLGLGLAIDYSLFVVSRYREELARHGPGLEALKRTMATAGRTVVFSSLTVAAALAALMVFPQRFLFSMGLGGALVALIAAVISLTVLPAVLALLGERVNSLAPARFRRAAEADARGEQGRWYRFSRWVMKRPGTIALSTAAVLIVVGLPFLQARFVFADAGILPPELTAKQVDRTLQADFDANRLTPVTIQFEIEGEGGGGVPPAIGRFADEVAAIDGVREVAPPQQIAPGLVTITAIQRVDDYSAAGERIVDEIRALPSATPFRVGGNSAALVDQKQSLSDHLKIAVPIIAVATFVLLFLMTGSVILPVKALIMNLLTVSAAFGILVLIFQDGRFEGLLSYDSQGALDSSQPILLFALIFGLSTDYGVFLLTRIKEARDSGAESNEAVAIGLEKTGRIVTFAALLFCLAIGAFVTSDIVFLKEAGLGTAIGVLIDATIVRALLVPSLMRLLGEWNWWAPGPLRRLHDRVGLSEG